MNPHLRPFILAASAAAPLVGASARVGDFTMMMLERFFAALRRASNLSSLPPTIPQISMKNVITCAALAASLSLFAPVVHGELLLTDNFTVLPGGINNQDVNQSLGNGRQTGTHALSPYTLGPDHHQVGNTTTDVGQPVVSDGNYVLIAFNGWFQNNLLINEALMAGRPLQISFNMYGVGSAGNASHGGWDDTKWNAFSLRGVGSDAFPVAGTDEFGMLQRWNGGLQVFTDGNSGITPGGWDTPGFATSPAWSFIFSDTAGTGSAFSGVGGSKVEFINGGVSLGTVDLGQLSTGGLVLGWRDFDQQFGGIDDLAVVAVPEPSVTCLISAVLGLTAFARRKRLP